LENQPIQLSTKLQDEKEDTFSIVAPENKSLKNNNEEFIETLEKAKLLCEAWWEKKGRENLFHSKSDVFETACWFINMKNRFKWTDKTEVLANVTFNVQNLIADVARAEKANSRGLAKISNN